MYYPKYCIISFFLRSVNGIHIGAWQVIKEKPVLCSSRNVLLIKEQCYSSEGNVRGQMCVFQWQLYRPAFLKYVGFSKINIKWEPGKQTGNIGKGNKTKPKQAIILAITVMFRILPKLDFI